MTIANTVAIAVVPFLGSLVDRVGPKTVMQVGNAGAAVAFVLYPFAHSLVAVTVLVFCATVTRQAFWSALGPMVTQITRAGGARAVVRVPAGDAQRRVRRGRCRCPRSR